MRIICDGLAHFDRDTCPAVAVCDSIPYEITTLRRDVETDGRRAVVAFTEDWHEDAMRRDFRCNALYAEPDGKVHDPVGGGIEDAAHGRVIFIGDADQRLREDYLRILRFFRFNAWYGAGIDRQGLAACERQREGLGQIAAERIWKELHKLLSAPNPSVAVEAMEKSGILQKVLPGAVSTDRLVNSVTMLNAAGTAPDPVRRLMTLLTPDLDVAASVSTALRLSNADRDRLENWATAYNQIGEEDLKEPEIYRAFYRFGTEAVLDYLFWRGPGGGEETAETLRELAQMASEWERPVFPLTGDDALQLGLSGPAIGRALGALESVWVDGDFSETRETLLGKLKTFA